MFISLLIKCDSFKKLGPTGSACCPTQYQKQSAYSNIYMNVCITKVQVPPMYTEDIVINVCI